MITEEEKRAALEAIREYDSNGKAVDPRHCETIRALLAPAPDDAEVRKAHANLIRSIDYVDEDNTWPQGTVGAKNIQDVYVCAHALFRAATSPKCDCEGLDGVFIDGLLEIKIQAIQMLLEYKNDESKASAYNRGKLSVLLDIQEALSEHRKSRGG